MIITHKLSEFLKLQVIGGGCFRHGAKAIIAQPKCLIIIRKFFESWAVIFVLTRAPSQLVFEPYMSQHGHKAKKGSRPHGREINPEEFPNGLSWLVYDPYLRKHGYHWKAAPKVIGRRAVAVDLPMGRLIANQEYHLVAVVNGVVHDTWDSRNDPVYGYYAPETLP